MPRLVLSALAAVLVLCVCAASAVYLTGRSRPETPARAEPERRAPVVFMLGDSYTVGIRGIKAERAYAAETARLLGWQIVVAGMARTGFAGTGGTGETFASLYTEQLAWRPTPDMVVVSGGHNDVGQPPGLVAQKARRLMETLQQRWPRTQVVLMGPLWGGDPGPKALRVRDVLREVARTMRIPFVDPLAGRWITGNVRKRTGNADRLIRADGTHPNPAGNRYLAQRLVDDLRAMRLDKPVLGRTKVTYSPPSPSPNSGTGHEQAIPGQGDTPRLTPENRRRRETEQP
ncbi:SGNH/GDSL hydrolase family protein [Actinomadura viridis]|uniref:SGNH/GDSL hydrolase family protein n=1 Tax=Actinomadura viridis TaxID=58110 RepID=UPI0036934E44